MSTERRFYIIAKLLGGIHHNERYAIHPDSPHNSVTFYTKRSSKEFANIPPSAEEPLNVQLEKLEYVRVGEDQFYPSNYTKMSHSHWVSSTYVVRFGEYLLQYILSYSMDLLIRKMKDEGLVPDERTAFAQEIYYGNNCKVIVTMGGYEYEQED